MNDLTTTDFMHIKVTMLIRIIAVISTITSITWPTSWTCEPGWSCVAAFFLLFPPPKSLWKSTWLSFDSSSHSEKPGCLASTHSILVSDVSFWNNSMVVLPTIKIIILILSWLAVLWHVRGPSFSSLSLLVINKRRAKIWHIERRLLVRLKLHRKNIMIGPCACRDGVRTKVSRRPLSRWQLSCQEEEEERALLWTDSYITIN